MTMNPFQRFRKLFLGEAQPPLAAQQKEKPVSTVRQVIQTKIDDLEADIAAARADLAKIETSVVGVIDQDIEVVKDWFASLTKHLG